MQRQNKLLRTLPATVRESFISELEEVPALLTGDAEDGWIEGIRTICAEFKRFAERESL